MSRIGEFAKGLLALTGSQNFGQGPRELFETVQPTVDVGKLYAVNKCVVRFGGVAALAAGVNSVPLAVPPNKVWLLIGASCSVIPPVGATGTFGLCAVKDGSALLLTDSANYIASTRAWVTSRYQDLVLPAGTDLAIIAQNVVGGPTPGSIQLMLAELDY